jgi:hypothetical protein
MSTVTQVPVEAKHQPVRVGVPAMPEVWGAVAIASMWVAVLVTAGYGGDFVSQSAGQTQSTTIPSAVFVAFFAFLASVAVAKRAFRGGGDHTS